MKCGCCLVTTDSKGIRDFSFDCKTALICKPRDSKGFMIKVSTTGMVVSLKTDLRFPIPGQRGHGDRIIQRFSFHYPFE